jgi:hypothetical protein
MRRLAWRVLAALSLLLAVPGAGLRWLGQTMISPSTYCWRRALGWRQEHGAWVKGSKNVNRFRAVRR